MIISYRWHIVRYLESPDCIVQDFIGFCNFSKKANRSIGPIFRISLLNWPRSLDAVLVLLSLAASCSSSIEYLFCKFIFQTDPISNNVLWLSHFEFHIVHSSDSLFF